MRLTSLISISISQSSFNRSPEIAVLGLQLCFNSKHVGLFLFHLTPPRGNEKSRKRSGKMWTGSSSSTFSVSMCWLGGKIKSPYNWRYNFLYQRRDDVIQRGKLFTRTIYSVRNLHFVRKNFRLVNRSAWGGSSQVKQDEMGLADPPPEGEDKFSSRWKLITVGSNL